MPILSEYEKYKRKAEIKGLDQDYLYTTMTPADWYQWFDPKQPSTGSWAQVYMIKDIRSDFCIICMQSVV